MCVHVCNWKSESRWGGGEGCILRRRVNLGEWECGCVGMCVCGKCG